MMEHVFQAQGVTKRYRKIYALNDFNFDLEPGAITVLLGPNGAGKTTLMRMALGTLTPNKGAMRILGMDPLKQPKQVRQRTGYVPSIPDAYDWMTLKDLFRFLRPQYPTWNDDYAREVINSLSIPRNIPFKAMSRGQAMKAMLVAALAPEPELLLLDEPFAGLDPLAREEVLRGVLGQIREENRTVLCATHDLDVASRLADRIAVISQGRLKKEGTVEDVLGCMQPARIPDRILDLIRDVVDAEEAIC